MTNARPVIAHNLPWLTSMLCALLPFVAVHCAYLLAASYGQVPWCVPYIDSCTSISATGRTPPASFVFRGIMLPSSVLMMLFWWIHWRWLHNGSASQRRHWMLGLGVLACIGLILYVTVLGEVGDWWRLQRRIGTILFFSFTFLAQLLLAADLRAVGDATSLKGAPVGGRLLRCCQLMLAIGVFSVVVQLISEDWHDAIEDAIEWVLALLLQLNFFFCASLWRDGDWWLIFERRAP